MRFCVFFVCVMVCLGVACPSFADDTATLQKAWETYNIGHYKETMTLLQPLASNGNATAQILVGRCYENGLGVPQNMETAAKWYALAAEQNNPQAMVLLGYCYEHGLGVPKDTAKTVSLMEGAANKGSAEAQFNVAMYYNLGKYGKAKDFNASFAWAKRSADQGYAEAERYVGACYENGIGTPVDLALAKEWFAKAAKKGLGKEGTIVQKHALP
ncbi:MAG: sel1 repeat family protein [Desulfovibrio sp.]|nr:sel1 repeat family protein [Desulfovibrio sp.]